MIPAIAFDFVMALAKETPDLLNAIANVAKSEADPAVIASERQKLIDGFDRNDPLGTVPTSADPLRPGL